jgi:hypothetical protein
MNLNPHHPVSQAVAGHWHKFLAAYMVKNGTREIVITVEDLKKAFEDPKGINIAVQELKDGIHITLHDDETAGKLARQHGGIVPPKSN